MARDLDESSYYVSHGGKVPVKWTAPEVPDHINMLNTQTALNTFAPQIKYNTLGIDFHVLNITKQHF